jgi:hypothetical protein
MSRGFDRLEGDDGEAPAPPSSARSASGTLSPNDYAVAQADWARQYLAGTEFTDAKANVARLIAKISEAGLEATDIGKAMLKPLDESETEIKTCVDAIESKIRYIDGLPYDRSAKPAAIRTAGDQIKALLELAHNLARSGIPNKVAAAEEAGRTFHTKVSGYVQANIKKTFELRNPKTALAISVANKVGTVLGIGATIVGAAVGQAHAGAVVKGVVSGVTSGAEAAVRFADGKSVMSNPDEVAALSPLIESPEALGSASGTASKALMATKAMMKIGLKVADFAGVPTPPDEVMSTIDDVWSCIEKATKAIAAAMDELTNFEAEGIEGRRDIKLIVDRELRANIPAPPAWLKLGGIHDKIIAVATKLGTDVAAKTYKKYRDYKLAHGGAKPGKAEVGYGVTAFLSELGSEEADAITVPEDRLRAVVDSEMRGFIDAVYSKTRTAQLPETQFRPRLAPPLLKHIEERVFQASWQGSQRALAEKVVEAALVEAYPTYAGKFAPPTPSRPTAPPSIATPTPVVTAKPPTPVVTATPSTPTPPTPKGWVTFDGPSPDPFATDPFAEPPPSAAGPASNRSHDEDIIAEFDPLAKEKRVQGVMNLIAIW